LIIEEYNELYEAYTNKDIVEIADACADLKWVIEGLEHTLNIPQQEVWNEVARSNLQKIGPDGKVLKREDGKVMKPEGWTPPDIKTLFNQ
jgi:predicted HAD superfamily Cof-like phosphohydrolase